MQAFDTYCKTVLRNKARNLHKAQERKVRNEIPLDELPPEVEESLEYLDEYDLSQSVPVNLSGELMTVSDPALAAAFVQFLPRFREVIYLAYYLEYSDKEIGDLLHIPISTVSSRRQNTLRKLRDILRENHAEQSH